MDPSEAPGTPPVLQTPPGSPPPGLAPPPPNQPRAPFHSASLRSRYASQYEQKPTRRRAADFWDFGDFRLVFIALLETSWFFLGFCTIFGFRAGSLLVSSWYFNDFRRFRPDLPIHSGFCSFVMFSFCF